MKMLSRDGVEMMEAKSIHREGDLLVLKGKVMGSMSTVIVIRPEDCWQAVRLLGWRIILYLPAILFKGFIRSFRPG